MTLEIKTMQRTMPKIKTGKKSLSKASPNQRAAEIRKSGKKIRDYAMELTETLKAMREAGTFKEVGGAVHDSVLTAKIIMEEIDATIKDLKRSGAMHEVGIAVKKVSKMAKHTGDVAHEVARKIVSETKTKGKLKKLVKQKNYPVKARNLSSRN
jgi:hypothetical protein